MSSSGDGDAVVLLGRRSFYWDHDQGRFSSTTGTDSVSGVAVSRGQVWFQQNERWTVWKPNRAPGPSVALPGNWQCPLLLGTARKGYAIRALSETEDEIVAFDEANGSEQTAFKIPRLELLFHCHFYTRAGERMARCTTENGQSWNDTEADYNRVAAAESGPKRIASIRSLGASLLAAEWNSQSLAWGTTVWEVPSVRVVATFALFFHGMPETSPDIVWPKPQVSKNLLVGIRNRFEPASATILEILDIERRTRTGIPLPDLVDGMTVDGTGTAFAVAGLTTPYVLSQSRLEWRAIEPQRLGEEGVNSRLFEGKPREGGVTRFEFLLGNRILAACDGRNYCEVHRVSDGVILWLGPTELGPRDTGSNTVCWSAGGEAFCVGSDWKIRRNQVKMNSLVAHGSSVEQISNRYCVWNGCVVPCSVCHTG